jgi:hypothetical protein
MGTSVFCTRQVQVTAELLSELENLSAPGPALLGGPPGLSVLPFTLSISVQKTQQHPLPRLRERLHSHVTLSNPSLLRKNSLQ